MDYELQPAVLPRFGRVDKLLVQGRWVGMVYRDPKGVDQMPELWIAYTAGGKGARTRAEAIDLVLKHAEAHPDFEVR